MGFFSDVVNGAREGYNRLMANGRIPRLCRDLGWPVDEVEGSLVKLRFNDSQAAQGIRKVVIANGDDSLVSFRVVSHAVLPGERLPEEVLGGLLMRNADRAVGSWGIHVKDGLVAFGLDYTALGEALDAPTLRFICEQLVREVSAFDARMRAAGLLR